MSSEYYQDCHIAHHSIFQHFRLRHLTTSQCSSHYPQALGQTSECSPDLYQLNPRHSFLHSGCHFRRSIAALQISRFKQREQCSNPSHGTQLLGRMEHREQVWFTPGFEKGDRHSATIPGCWSARKTKPKEFLFWPTKKP